MMGQSRGELPLLLLINRRRREGEGGENFWRERRAVTEREARPSRVKEQKTEAKRKKQRGKLSEKREEQRLWGHCTEEKKDRSSPPGHHRCASSPPPQQHRHPATINAANASRTREGEEKQKRNRGQC
jgi:hypothetical protein